MQPPSFDTYTGEPREFRRFVDDLLDEYDSKYANGQRFACEFSGGIDSSIIAGHYAINGRDPLLITAGFPDEFGISQQQKIDDFRQRFQTEHFVVPLDPEQHFPLSHMAANDSWEVFYEENEIYYPTFNLLASHVKSQGIEIAYNGLGGDDSLARFDFAVPLFPLPSFFQPELRQRYVPQSPAYQDDTFASLLDQVIGQKVNCNNTYIAHDVWPIAPFTDPRFIQYAQSLRPRYRDNKNIFRIYCEAWQYPQSTFHPDVNETFAPYLGMAMSDSFAALAREWLTNSRLASAGVVDIDDFYAYAEQADSLREQLTVLRFLIVEVNLQLFGIAADSLRDGYDSYMAE